MNRAPRSRQAGLSLVELMVSVAIGLLILTGVVYVFVNTSDARRELERTSRQLENGRFAIDLLGDDLRMAGFYGELNVGSLTAPTALPDPCSATVADWNSAIPVHVQGYYNGLGAPASCLIAGLNILAGTDILVVRRARACLAGVGTCPAAVGGMPYVQASLCANEVSPQHVLDTANFTLKKKDCTTAADKRQYFVNIYYVSTDNGSGVSVPTLKRLTFTPGSGATASSPANFTVDPLVEGIERFHLEYGLDTTTLPAPDGSPDIYINDPNDYPASACTGACPVNNWMNVMTVHVYLVARNLEKTPGYSDAKTYQLGTVPYTPASAVTGYRRHGYSTLVRLTNPAGRRDRP